ncbi:MAG TPA: lipoprotein insertase outer membrane protein LolB [Gammaproteobacteria bacterium]|nr:lipoprotein insertase outer membrane protein LolB [Gammaproteobacteria bacterium]
MRWNSTVSPILLCMLLAACAHIRGVAPSGAPNEAAWQQRRARLAQLKDWDMEGRVGVSNGRDGGSGTMSWTQQGDAFQFDFQGPFGAGALSIHGVRGVLHIRSSRGDDFISRDPERDFARLLHVPLPVLSMRYWVTGSPAPDAAYDKRVDAQGRLVQLDQYGWQVSYLTYAVFDGYDLPTRLVIERDKVRIKLAIETWQVVALPADARIATP